MLSWRSHIFARCGCELKANLHLALTLITQYVYTHYRNNMHNTVYMVYTGVCWGSISADCRSVPNVVGKVFFRCRVFATLAYQHACTREKL